MTQDNVEVILYTDGACSGNPGPGGWAFILHHNATGTRKEAFGADKETTNNRMEMTAVIQGLSSLKRPVSVRIVTDSEYVMKGVTQWMANWKKNGWRRKTRSGWEPVKNVELWQKLDEQVQKHNVQFEYVRGHTGHPENERCDELAVAAYKNL
ncbi:MAG: ribonuclease HI [bacterium]|nr:ribonuclease HI [bacterium]